MAKNKNEQPQYYISPINTQVMNYAVYVMKPTEKLMTRAILFVLGGLVGMIFYGGLFKSEGQATLLTTISDVIVFSIVGLIANKIFFDMVVESKRIKRINILKQQFCDFLSALANSLSSGMNMNDSLLAVYNDLREQFSDDAHIVVEIKEIIGGMNNNIPIEEMLMQFGIRSGVDDIVNFATVFSTCYRTGGDIKSVVRRTADIISEKVMISSEIQTAMTSNKMQMNVMNVLPLVIVQMMKMLSSAFAESFATIIGVFGLTITLSLTFAAFKMGQKITDIKG